MRTTGFAAILAVFTLALAAVPARALDFDQTLRLLQSGVTENTLISMIAVDPPTFTPNAVQVNQLRAAGAGQGLINALNGAVATSVATMMPVPAFAGQVEEVSVRTGFAELVNRSGQSFGVFVDPASRRLHLAAPDGAPHPFPPGAVVRIPVTDGRWTLGVYGDTFVAEIWVNQGAVTSVGIDPSGTGLRAVVNDGAGSRFFTLVADHAVAPSIPFPPQIVTAPAPVFIQQAPQTVIVGQPVTTVWPTQTVFVPARSRTSFNLDLSFGNNRRPSHWGGRQPSPRPPSRSHRR